MSLPLNQVVLGDCVEVMAGWPADSIDLVVTSPPYWGLRDYGSETFLVWGGDPECEHEWTEITKHRSAGGPQVPQSINPRNISVVVAQRDNISNFCYKCGAWRGSLGLEPHPQMFIDHLVEICQEIKRVLKPSGTFWLNLGDTYCGSWGNYGAREGKQRAQNVEKLNRKGQPAQNLRVPQSYTEKSGWLQPKQLLGMPWRVAIALQHDGWVLRNDIIWHKPNHMPSSVKDRLTNAYEHVFLFAKARRYYFDLDAIRKPFSKGTFLRIRQPNIDNQPGGSKTLALRGGKPQSGNASRPIDMAQELSRKIASGEITGKNPGDVWKIDKPIISNSRKELHGPTYRRHQIKIKGGQAIGLHPLGKNPGDVLSGSKYLEQEHPHSIRVKGGHTGDYTHPRGKNPGDLWRIPTHPFPAAHFATFPPTLIEPIIKAGSPRWICSKCGKPRIRITEPTPEYAKKLGKSVHNHKDDLKRGMRYDKVYNAEYMTTGWSDCGCGESWNPGVVLDPFCGSGTALRVARRLGRHFIGIDIVPEYVEMAHRRIRGDKYREPPKGVVQLDKIMEADR